MEVHVKAKGITCGLVLGMDPVTCWAQISLMLFGRLAMQLPIVLEALKLVNKQWKERNKSLKKAGEKDEL